MEEVKAELLWGLQWEEDADWHNTCVSKWEIGQSSLYACGPSCWPGQALTSDPLWTPRCEPGRGVRAVQRGVGARDLGPGCRCSHPSLSDLRQVRVTPSGFNCTVRVRVVSAYGVLAA